MGFNWNSKTSYEIINASARNKSDVQYMESNGSMCKNFNLLVIYQIFLIGKDRILFTKKLVMEFLEKTTSYQNDAIHDDCANIMEYA